MKIVTVTLAALAMFIAVPAKANGVNPMMYIAMAQRMMHAYPMQHRRYDPREHRRIEPRFYGTRRFIERREFVAPEAGYGWNGGGGYGYESHFRARRWYHHFESHRVREVTPVYHTRVRTHTSHGCGCCCNCCGCGTSAAADPPGDPPGNDPPATLSQADVELLQSVYK